MNYAQMKKSVVELEAEVKRLIKEAEATDELEDWQYGQGWCGNELHAAGLSFED